MSSLSLNEHILRSRQAVEANKAKGNRHAELLSGLYADSSRFLEELIQNAEDACRLLAPSDVKKRIKFRLFENRLEMLHNGRPFNADDLKSITTFANTTKSEYRDVNLIGKFGIGFKSVFAVCDEPHIHSGDYHFKITDYEILEDIRPQQFDPQYSTLLVFPFKNDRSIHSIVEKGLKKLGSRHLLFLDQIDIIEIELPAKSNVIIKKTSSPLNNGQYIVRFDISGKRNDHEEFILFKKAATSVNGIVAIAYLLEGNNGVRTICSAGVTALFSWFPTLQNSGLQFFIHAPFTTTPTREHIPFDKARTPENIRLAAEIVKLFTSSLTALRDGDWLSPSWLTIMPLELPDTRRYSYEPDSLYGLIHTAFLLSVQHKKLLPCGQGKFCKAREACLIEDDELAVLCGKQGAAELFNCTNIIDNDCWRGSQQVRDLLVSVIRMREITAENFAFRLSVNVEFLQNQKPGWFVKLYNFLLKHPPLWDEMHASEYYSLRNMAIILTNNKILTPAFNSSGTPLIFPASKRGSGLHSAIRHDTGALQFVNALLRTTVAIVNGEAASWMPDVPAHEAMPVLIRYVSSNAMNTGAGIAAPARSGMVTVDFPVFSEMSQNAQQAAIHEWAVEYVICALQKNFPHMIRQHPAPGIDICYTDEMGSMCYIQVMARTIGQIENYASDEMLRAAIMITLEEPSAKLFWAEVQAAGSQSAKGLLIPDPIRLLADGKIIISHAAIKINEL